MSGHGYYIARHTKPGCGKVVGAIVDDAGPERIANFRATCEHYSDPVEHTTERPGVGDWCGCFIRGARRRTTPITERR